MMEALLVVNQPARAVDPLFGVFVFRAVGLRHPIHVLIHDIWRRQLGQKQQRQPQDCLLYTSDAADE